MNYVAKIEGDIPEREVEIYRNIFNEELTKLVPSMLKDIWDEKDFIFHELPKMSGSVVEMYGGYDGEGNHQDITRIEIAEYADYRKLPALDPGTIIEEIKSLAFGAVESYAWNVRNAFLKGGRLVKGFSNRRLHLTDWKKEFHVNVAMAAPSLCPGDSKFKGWVAYRYRFVAAKL